MRPSYLTCQSHGGYSSPVILGLLGSLAGVLGLGWSLLLGLQGRRLGQLCQWLPICYLLLASQVVVVFYFVVF